MHKCKMKAIDRLIDFCCANYAKFGRQIDMQDFLNIRFANGTIVN